MFGPHVRQAALTRPALTAPQGLVGYWPFDLGSLNWGANKAFDRSGRGNDGTLVAITSAALVAGKVRQALSLNGSSQYITANNQLSIGPTSVFTLAAWLKSASNQSGGAAQRRVAIGIKANTNDFQISIGFPYNGDNEWSLEAGKAGVASQQLSATATQTTGLWYHVAGVFRNGSALLYVNGVLQGSVTYSATVNGATANTAQWVIGTEFLNAAAASYFPGSIGQARIYNRALLAQEILSIYTAGLSGRA